MKRKMKNRVGCFFLYGGLSKEEYEAVKIRIDRHNAVQIRVLSFVFFLMSAVLLFWSYLDLDFSYVRDMAVTGTTACLLICLGMKYIRKIREKACLMGYFLILLGYILGFMLSMDSSNVSVPAITAICLLALFPMVMVDVPWRMAVVMFMGMNSFLGMCFRFSSAEVFIEDRNHVIPLMVFSYTLFSVISCTMYRYVYRNYASERELMELSETDQLTRVLNRNGLRKFLDADGQKILMERETPVCILMLDIDFFKKVNDTYGHDAGDRILVFMAETICSCVRASDHVVRWGGEEFLLFLMDTELEKGLEAAERIRSAVEQADNGICKITVSIGAAAYDGYDYHAAVKKADEGLYYAKGHGRNQVVVR